MKLINPLSIVLLSVNMLQAYGENNLLSALLMRRKGVKVSAGSGGDPHFRTYDGTTYSFHGQCDLVMARSHAFGSGLGLDLHARTEMIENWSLISNAAIRIGSDILEVVNDGSIVFNGVKDVEFPLLLAGQYNTTKGTEFVETVHEDGSRVNNTRSFFVIDLGDDDNILLTTYKSMISVEVNALLEDTEGMLGIHSKPGMIGRDRGTVLMNANDMGLQWQVNDNERMLFNKEKFPQFPEECVLPNTLSRRRLRQSPRQLKVATSACEKVPADMRQFCIDDVILTGDVDISGVYSIGF